MVIVIKILPLDFFLDCLLLSSSGIWVDLVFGEDAWTSQFPENVTFKAHLSTEQDITMQRNAIRGNAIFRKISAALCKTLLHKLIFHTTCQSKMLKRAKESRLFENSVLYLLI